MWPMLVIVGVFTLLGGGAGYFVADSKLNDGDFRFEHYGSSTFGEMIDLRNISQFAIILGVLLIVVGVVLYAVSVSKHNSKSGGSGHSGEWVPTVQPQPGAVRFCVNCGKPLTAGGKFCPYCGHESLETVRRCACGSILEDDAIFCPDCGKKYQTQGGDT